MGGLVVKPRATWNPVGKTWMVYDNCIIFHGWTIPEATKLFYDAKYGKDNHGYR